jgi:tetratricopeptide (TPR) repeat protein
MAKFHKVSPFAKKLLSAEKTKIVSSNINYRLEETGTNLYNSNDLVNAEIFFDSLIFLNEEYFNAWNFKGMIQTRQRKFETGFNCLNIALNLAKKDNEKNLVLYSFSNYFALKGDNTNAIIYLEKAIKLGFKNYEAIVNDKDLISIHKLAEFTKLMGDSFPENIKK